MLREIVLDTETTGLSPETGDRVVEIGCVELIDHLPTGKTFHAYVNPERDMPEGAFRVHGLSEQFLSEKPLFGDIAGEFDDFLEQSVLIIHNAPFDMGFLNAELANIGKSRLSNSVIDTVQLAKKVHPGARVSLDALCKLYGIDNSRRSVHGALLDSEILAEVYLELIGGRQAGLSLSAFEEQHTEKKPPVSLNHGPRPAPLTRQLSPDQRDAHAKLVQSLGKKPIWHQYN